MTPVAIGPAVAADKPDWLAMRIGLWPDEGHDQLEHELDSVLDPGLAGNAWIARATDGRAAGFIETSLRSHAEGCGPGPAPYVEGLWVAPDFRRQGVATALLLAVEDWARAQGFAEIGSDALIDNLESHGWHGASGFAEIERLVVFRKPL